MVGRLFPRWRKQGRQMSSFPWRLEFKKECLSVSNRLVQSGIEASSSCKIPSKFPTDWIEGLVLEYRMFWMAFEKESISMSRWSSHLFLACSITIFLRKHCHCIWQHLEALYEKVYAIFWVGLTLNVKNVQNVGISAFNNRNFPRLKTQIHNSIYVNWPESHGRHFTLVPLSCWKTHRWQSDSSKVLRG